MSDSAPTLSRLRQALVRVLAVVGLVSFSFAFVLVAGDGLGLIASDSVGSPEDPPPSAIARAGAEAPGEAVHVAGSLAVLATGAAGLVALVLRPHRSGPAYQVLAVTTAMLLTTPIVGNPDNHGGQAGVIDPVFVVLALPGFLAAAVARPWRTWHSDGARRTEFLVLAAVGALPAIWYGVGQGLMQRNTFPPTADPHHNAHWWAMSVFAFMVILVVATATISARGWRLAAGVAGLGAVGVATASIVAPSAASAVGSAWGIAAVLWGGAVVWLTSSRRPVVPTRPLLPPDPGRERGHHRHHAPGHPA